MSSRCRSRSHAGKLPANARVNTLLGLCLLHRPLVLVSTGDGTAFSGIGVVVFSRTSS